MQRALCNRPVLEPALGENRHIEGGNCLQSTGHDLTLELIESLHVIIGQINERNALRDCDHRRSRERTEATKAKVMTRGVGSAIRAAQSAAVRQGVFDFSHSPTFLIQHGVIDYAANCELRILLEDRKS